MSWRHNPFCCKQNEEDDYEVTCSTNQPMSLKKPVYQDKVSKGFDPFLRGCGRNSRNSRFG